MSAIKIDPEIMGGVPCFDGTRVPVKYLFEWIAAGHTVGYFLDQFPGVRRSQAAAVLSLAARTVAPDPEWLRRETNHVDRPTNARDNGHAASDSPSAASEPAAVGAVE